MTQSLVDLSGNPLPRGSTRAGTIPHVTAASPIRVFPPRDATEFLYSAFSVLAAGIVKMTNPNTGTGVSDLRTGADYQGHIDYLICECADVTPGTFPNNIFMGLTFNAGVQTLNNQVWQTFPFLSSGATALLPCSVTLPINLDIPPSTLVELIAANTEGVTHHLDAYVHGWIWPISEQD